VRAAQLLVGPKGRQRGPGPTGIPPPLLAATRTSTRRGPPATAFSRHLGRSASFEARRAAKPSFRPSRAAFGRTRGPPARSSTDNAPPAAAGRHAHRRPRWAPEARCWWPSGPIRAAQSPQSCPCMCLSEPRSLLSGPGAASEDQARSQSLHSSLGAQPHHRRPRLKGSSPSPSGPSRTSQSPLSCTWLRQSRVRW